MTSFLEECQQYNQKRKEIDRRALTGETDPPCCFRCKAPSTHVTDGITPAGYRSYMCEAHVPKKKTPLWGSDPGWQNDFIPIEEARAAFQARIAPTAS